MGNMTNGERAALVAALVDAELGDEIREFVVVCHFHTEGQAEEECDGGIMVAGTTADPQDTLMLLHCGMREVFRTQQEAGGFSHGE